MKKLIVLISLICFAIPVVCHAEPKPQTKMWARMSVNRAVFQQDLTREAILSFAVVNEGSKTVDSEISTSRLFINNKEVQNWRDVARRGDGFGWMKSLKPGQSAEFRCELGEHFEQPGFYTVRWIGKTFKAQAVNLRVLPLRERVPTAVVLTRLIRTQLSKGWKASYDPKYGWLEVTRLAPTNIREIGVPNDYNRNGDEPPPPSQFDFALRVEPFVSPADFQTLMTENVEIDKQLNTLYKTLNGLGMDQKFDDFSPRTSQEKVQVAQYELLRKSRHHLPRFYFRDISLSWAWPGANFPFDKGLPERYYRFVLDKTVSAECADVTKRITRLLTRYEAAPVESSDE